jgi:3-carboxy-cis,cis-muconate cycloisomerase
MNAFERFVSDSPVAELFGGRAMLTAMLDFEAALARAQASCGLIPVEAAEVIASACDLEGFDVEVILRRSGDAGSLAIPLVQALTAKVQAVSPGAARHVHWGSTSQDVIDTALVLQTRKALGLIDAELA